MRLRIHHPDATPYVVGGFYADWTLEDAIAAEADNVASMAGSDELEDGTEEARDALRAKVIADATRALRGAGASYRDPLGIRWSLEAD